LGNVISWSAVENLFTGVPLDEPGPAPRVSADDPSPSPFWTRLSTQVARRPVRLVVACVATVLGPAVVAHAGALPSPVTATAAAAQPAGLATRPATPVPGDTATWLAVARQAAATCPGLSSSVLVAIAQVETGLGASAASSSAGALGPMQFLPSTWAAYGVDGDGDGRADVTNPVDAMHGAARLLCANGGADPDRLPGALWNYNHSDAYVRQVMAAASQVPAAA
jgi:hypothetical protein